MPDSNFSLGTITPLSNIPSDGKIHVIGVCGVAMAQLSIVLSEQGYKVSGSDQQFYEPMGSLLKASSVHLLDGYNAENVPRDADLVVIGNAVTKDHIEVLQTEKLKLPFTCFPRLLQELVIAENHSIVVTGTHGKSTTTSMVAFLLEELSLSPSYFLGGVSHNLASSFKIGRGGYSVVEGDEYDSAFFAKVPKFSFYKPKTCIVNAIEFDHADIYTGIDAITSEFTKLISGIPEEGTVICCLDYEHIQKLIPLWKEFDCSVVTFGVHPQSDYRIIERIPKGELQLVRIMHGGEEFHFTLPLIGEYNAKNALATLITSDVLGLDRAQSKSALVQYKGVKRRQEVRYAGDAVTLIEDFAHHPTSIDGTLQAVRESYPDRKIWAVFEPRSNTSRMSLFEEEYISIFSQSDFVILREVAIREEEDTSKLIDVGKICDAIGEKAYCSPSVEEIAGYIRKHLTGNDVVVVMTNGSFDGLIDQLQESFQKT